VAKLLDTHRYLNVDLTHSGTAEDFHYIDVARMLSQTNRRLYRQGMYYGISNVVFHDTLGKAEVRVCTAPNTWMTKAAWQLGYKNWRTQRRRAVAGLDEGGLGRRAGKWSDFKVYLNEDMLDDIDQQGGADQVGHDGSTEFVDSEGNILRSGEWLYSRFVLGSDDLSNTADTAPVGLMGSIAGGEDSYSYISLLEALDQVMKEQVQDPVFDAEIDESVYSKMGLGGIQSEMADNILAVIEGENDLPPYDYEYIPGAGDSGTNSAHEPWVVRSCNIASTASPMAAVGGFLAPCGLVCIETKGDTDANVIGCTIEVAPGSYKGVHAIDINKVR